MEIYFKKSNIMDNLELKGKIEIPAGYRTLDPENIIKKDDKICHVSGRDLYVSWISPDATEIGLVKSKFGESSLIIRKV